MQPRGQRDDAAHARQQPAQQHNPPAVAPDQRIEVTVELVFADRDALRRHLEERLGVTILAVEVLEIDYVRETTRVALRSRERPAEAAVGPHELDARLGGLAG